MLHQKIGPAYKWVVLVFRFLMVLLCAGFCCGNKSLYLAAITEALDIRRSTYALSDTFFQISTAVSSLFWACFSTALAPSL